MLCVKLFLHLLTIIVFGEVGVKTIKNDVWFRANSCYRPLFGTVAYRIGCYRGCRCVLVDLRLIYCNPVEHEHIRVSKGIHRRALSEMGAHAGVCVGGDDGSMVGGGPVQRSRKRRRGE